MRFTSAQLPPAVELSPWLWVAAGALLLLAATAVACLLRRRRGRNAQHAARARELARVDGLGGNIQALLHELSTMIATAEANLDARAQRLEQLIRAADERIEYLRSTHANDNGHATAPRPEISASAEVDARHAQIYALTEEGLSAHEIAEQLGRPKGEVELILALRPRGRATV